MNFPEIKESTKLKQTIDVCGSAIQTKPDQTKLGYHSVGGPIGIGLEWVDFGWTKV